MAYTAWAANSQLAQMLCVYLQTLISSKCTCLLFSDLFTFISCMCYKLYWLWLWSQFGMVIINAFVSCTSTENQVKVRLAKGRSVEYTWIMDIQSSSQSVNIQATRCPVHGKATENVL